MTEARVTLVEVAAQLGVGGEITLNGLGKRVQPDWCGRPSLSVADATRLVAEHRKANEEHETAWRQHQAANEQWLAGRVAAARAAQAKVTAGRQPSPMLYARGRKAWLTGAIEFQRRNPLPTWDGAPSLNAGLLYSADDLGSYGTPAADDGGVWREVH